MKTIQSSNESWRELKTHWNKEIYFDAFSGLRTVLKEAENAETLAQSLGDVGTVTCTIKTSLIQEVEDLQQQLKIFCEKIHEQVSQYIDEPFYEQIQGYVNAVYNLNPKNLGTGSDPTKINSSDYTSIMDALSGLNIDSDLLADFKSKMSDLDTDGISKTLKEAMDEQLGQWRDKLPFEDMKEIDRKIWGALNGTIDSQFKDFDTETIKEICKYYYRNSPYWILMDSDFQDTAHYISTSNGVYIDMSKDRDNPRNPYTTWFHEYSHWMDNNGRDVADGVDIREVSAEYISTGKYSQEFYDALVDDSEKILSNYGTANDVIDIIRKEAGSFAKASEFTDIMCAVYDCGETVDKYTYKHSTTYWEYSEEKQKGGNTLRKPKKEKLNKEAFAHFTEMSLMQDSTDVKMLKKYYPNAYRVYLKMMKEDMRK